MAIYPRKTLYLIAQIENNIMVLYKQHKALSRKEKQFLNYLNININETDSIALNINMSDENQIPSW